MTALTQEVAIKQIQEQLRDMRQSIQSLTDVVQQHRKDAVDDRILVGELGELVNKLTMQKATGNARQARK